jgi:hypothetical protein
MKKLRDVPLRYRVAAVVYGGISLFLFGVVFALVRREYRIPMSPAWVMAALIALVAAVGAFSALAAWGALSDPKSRLGSWAQRKMSVADAAEGAVGLLCGEAFVWVGVLLTLLAGSYSTYMGAAALLCWVLFFVLIVRRELKRDIKALDDPNDNPRANRLIGKRRERGSYDDRD